MSQPEEAAAVETAAAALTSLAAHPISVFRQEYVSAGGYLDPAKVDRHRAILRSKAIQILTSEECKPVAITEDTPGPTSCDGAPKYYIQCNCRNDYRNIGAPNFYRDKLWEQVASGLMSFATNMELEQQEIAATWLVDGDVYQIRNQAIGKENATATPLQIYPLPVVGYCDTELPRICMDKLCRLTGKSESWMTMIYAMGVAERPRQIIPAPMSENPQTKLARIFGLDVSAAAAPLTVTDVPAVQYLSEKFGRAGIPGDRSNITQKPAIQEKCHGVIEPCRWSTRPFVNTDLLASNLLEHEFCKKPDDQPIRIVNLAGEEIEVDQCQGFSGETWIAGIAERAREVACHNQTVYKDLQTRGVQEAVGHNQSLFKGSQAPRVRQLDCISNRLELLLRNTFGAATLREQTHDSLWKTSACVYKTDKLDSALCFHQIHGFCYMLVGVPGKPGGRTTFDLKTMKETGYSHMEGRSDRTESKMILDFETSFLAHVESRGMTNVLVYKLEPGQSLVVAAGRHPVAHVVPGQPYRNAQLVFHNLELVKDSTATLSLKDMSDCEERPAHVAAMHVSEKYGPDSKDMEPSYIRQPETNKAMSSMVRGKAAGTTNNVPPSKDGVAAQARSNSTIGPHVAEPSQVEKHLEQRVASTVTNATAAMTPASSSEQEAPRQSNISSWTAEEDARLYHAVTTSPEKTYRRWSILARQFPGRIGKQLRERWLNHLDPQIDQSPFTHDEDRKLYYAVKQHGTRWVEISTKHFDSRRADNHLKNRFYSAPFKTFVETEVGADPSIIASNKSQEKCYREVEKQPEKQQLKQRVASVDPTDEKQFEEQLEERIASSLTIVTAALMPVAGEVKAVETPSNTTKFAATSQPTEAQVSTNANKTTSTTGHDDVPIAVLREKRKKISLAQEGLRAGNARVASGYTEPAALGKEAPNNTALAAGTTATLDTPSLANPGAAKPVEAEVTENPVLATAAKSTKAPVPVNETLDVAAPSLANPGPTIPVEAEVTEKPALAGATKSGKAPVPAKETPNVAAVKGGPVGPASTGGFKRKEPPSTSAPMKDRPDTKNSVTCTHSQLQKKVEQRLSGATLGGPVSSTPEWIEAQARDIVEAAVEARAVVTAAKLREGGLIPMNAAEIQALSEAKARAIVDSRKEPMTPSQTQSRLEIQIWALVHAYTKAQTKAGTYSDESVNSAKGTDNEDKGVIDPNKPDVGAAQETVAKKAAAKTTGTIDCAKHVHETTSVKSNNTGSTGTAGSKRKEAPSTATRKNPPRAKKHAISPLSQLQEHNHQRLKTQLKSHSVPGATGGAPTENDPGQNKPQPAAPETREAQTQGVTREIAGELGVNHAMVSKATKLPPAHAAKKGTATPVKAPGDANHHSPPAAATRSTLPIPSKPANAPSPTDLIIDDEYALYDIFGASVEEAVQAVEIAQKAMKLQYDGAMPPKKNASEIMVWSRAKAKDAIKAEGDRIKSSKMENLVAAALERAYTHAQN